MNLTRRSSSAKAVRRGLLPLLLIALLVAVSGCANRNAAESDTANYPIKPITLIVPYQAGGASDLSARTLAAQMEESLGQPIVVQNRTGAAGSVGLKFLAEQPADGYTIGYMPVETVMLQHQGYDLDPTTFDLLGQIVAVPATIGVPATSPYKTLRDLVEAAKAKPDTVTVANSGAGSIWQAATTALGETGEVSFRPVPFDGGAPAVTAAIGDQVDAVAAGASETSTPAKDGRLRVLAIFDAERSPALPDVPTAAEAGYDVQIGGWGGIGAPKGFPEPVAAKLEEAVKVAAASSEYTSVIEKAGNVPQYRSAAEFKTFYDAESERFKTLLAAR